MAATQTHPILAPREGLLYSEQSDLITDLHMSNCQNVFVENGLIKKRYGYRKFGTNLPLSGPLMGFDQFYKFSGAQHLLAMTTKDIYQWHAKTKEWDLLTEHTSIDNCDDDPVAWTASESENVTVERETTEELIKEGEASIKITIADEFDTGLVAYHDQTGSITAFAENGGTGKVTVTSASHGLVNGNTVKISDTTNYNGSYVIGSATTDTFKITHSWEGDDAAGTWTLDFSAYNHVRFWICPSINLAAGDLQFLMDDTAACESPLRLIDLPALTADTWKQVFLDIRDENGETTDLDEIVSIGLKATADFGASVLYVDAIDAYKCFTGTDIDFFSYDYIQKNTEKDLWWVCTNNVDNIKKFEGITFEDLGGSPPKSKHLLQYKTYLHLLDTTEGGDPYHQRDRWSDTADPENWSTGNANHAPLPGADWITGAALFKGDYLVAFKERSIWVGYPTEDSAIFDFDPKQTDVGCAAGRTIASFGDELAFMGWDNIYVFKGIDYESIGDNIRTEFLANLNPENINRSFGVIIEEQQEYWLFVVWSNESYPNGAWGFNYNLNIWTKHKFAHYLTAYGYYFREEGIRWADLVGTWAVQNWRWGDRKLLTEAPTTLFGDKDGNVYEYTRIENSDDGQAIDAFFDTKDYTMHDANGLPVRQRLMGFDVYYTGPSLSIYYSTDRGKTWFLYATLATSTNLDKPVQIRKRVNALFFRLRFRNSQLNEHFEFERASMYRQVAGTRLN